MELSYRIKGHMLNIVFKTGIVETPPFKIQAFDGNTEVSDKYDLTFASADSVGQIDATGAINIAVGLVEVNRLKLFKYGVSDYTVLHSTIDLEEGEIKDFTGEESGGIYRINTFRVAI